VERLIFAIAIERHNRGRVNGKLKYLIMNSLLKLIPSAAGTITLKKTLPLCSFFSPVLVAFLSDDECTF